MITGPVDLGDPELSSYMATTTNEDVDRVRAWCADNGLPAAFYGRVYGKPSATGPLSPFVDYWIVPDSGHRMHFVMRWG